MRCRRPLGAKDAGVMSGFAKSRVPCGGTHNKEVLYWGQGLLLLESILKCRSLGPDLRLSSDGNSVIKRKLKVVRDILGLRA